MPGEIRKIFFVLLLGMLPKISHADISDHDISAGMSFSPKGTGIVCIVRKCENISRFMINADLEGVLRGESSTPGIKGYYSLEHQAFMKKFDSGAVMRVYFGPGFSAGFVRDIGKSHGIVASLDCSTTADFAFPSSPFGISAGLTGGIGCHIVTNGTHDTGMTFYKAGLYRMLEPVITIRYRF